MPRIFTKSCSFAPGWPDPATAPGFSFIIVFGYIPSNGDLFCFQEKVMKSLAEDKYTIIMGDFNNDLMRDDYKCKRISNFFLSNGIYQLIRENTRVTGTSTSSIDHACVFTVPTIL